nr:YihY family inner membrane protein [Actinomycetota bacterium]
AGDRAGGAGERAAAFARRVRRYAAAFLRRAYTDNLTGLSGMVAYQLLLSILPLALLALFFAGRVLQSAEVEESVLRDLRDLFPGATRSALSAALDRIRGGSTGLGIVALVSSVWIGASFWGALDTACCRIYHVECRSWVEQKRFALAMLVVVIAFMAATVLVPTVQSLLASGATDLPFGLAEVRELVFGVTLVVGLLLLFLILCVIYWTVPNRRVPWRAVWPGAAGATLAIGIVDYAFPFYLSKISTFTAVGTTFVFVVIVLLWFYALAFIILSGATINAMRFELHDTGELRPRP